MLTLNLLKFTDTKGWIHMAHKQDIQADTEEKTSVGKELFQWVLVIIGAVILAVTTKGFRTQPSELAVDTADSDQPTNAKHI